MTGRLTLRLLGPLEIALDGALIETDRRKALALLAYLAVTRQAHRRETLAALFWPDYEPAKAYAYLRRTLWEINQALGEGWLDAGRETAGLRPEAALWVDVLQFQHVLADRAEGAQSLPRLQEAVALYRGDFLSGLALRDSPGFDDWQRALAENLRGQFGAALQTLAGAYAAHGHYPAALSQAQRWLALDALNEAAQRQVMELLALSGQRHAALRQYETCARVLKAELDVAPEAATTALYQRLRAEDVPSASPEADPPDNILQALRSARLAPKHNLPAPLTSFIGREKDIATIKHLLAPLSRPVGEGPGVRARLVTLTGAGGTGKTRLSLRVAGELVPAFPDGVWFVEFAPLADPALVPQTVGAALKLREEKERPWLTVLTDHVCEKTLLLLFDNCEHLIDACARLAEALLRAGPNVWLIATSREALGLAGEVAVRIPSLSLPAAQTTQRETLVQSEAGRLFVERAQTAWPGFEVTAENLPAIAQVCRRLDGIPLAIELAAARVKTLRVEQIAARLDDRFHLLTGGSRTALPRQQTLRALIDWSYNLLTAPERALLRRLSVFAGGWTLEAAEAVGGAELDVLDGLAQLVNKSLVVAERQPGADTRYALLETIRQYAREKLLETDEGPALRQRHAQFFVPWAEAQEAEMHGPQLVAALQRLETEHDNIRAALEWALAPGASGGADRAEAGLRLGGAVWQFWSDHSHWSEGRDWLSKLLALPGAQARALPRAKALSGLAFLSWMQSEPELSRPLYEESLALWREVGDPRQTGYLHTLRVLGEVTFYTRDQARGRALIEESLALAQAAGDTIETAWSLSSLGRMAEEAGRREAARAFYTQSLALHRQAHLPTGIAYLLNRLGRLALTQADWATAQPLVEESLRLFRDLGEKNGLAEALNALGDVEWLRGQAGRGLVYFTECLAVARETNDLFLVSVATHALAWMNLGLGHLALAQQQFLQCLHLGREHRSPEAVMYSLAGLAAVAEAQGRPARAVQLLSAAQTQHSALNPDWYGDTLYQMEVNRLQAALRPQLAEAAFAEAWAAGAKMTLDEAAAYAVPAGP